jgi:hypothetical protein
MTIYLLDSMGICTGPVELPVIPGLGAHFPSNAIELDAELPPPAPGHVWIWKDATTLQIADNRGMAYRTDTGKEEPWTELGELPDHLTLDPRPGVHHVWTEHGWELDEVAEQAALVAKTLDIRDSLLYEAGLRIAPLQDAIELDRATPEDEAALRQWKGYRVDLNRIEDQEGFPEDIEWPTQPETRKPH